MLDNHYINPKLASIYEIDSGWAKDSDFYLSLASKDKKQNILDIGCGTGLISRAYAERNHNVTAIDPSAAMLEIGRKSLHGDKVEWVESFSQDYHSDKKFDLIIMTGHAFQALLSDNDISKTLNVMKNSLKDQGLIAFETRNPDIDWQSRWDCESKLKTPYGEVKQSREFISMRGRIKEFKTKYKFKDEELTSNSSLLFPSKSEIEEMINKAQLKVKNIFGNWDKSDFDPDSSDEMIFLLGHKS